MRTVLSFVVLAAVLWASCTVKLGRYTLAEHVDRIGGTDEAKALLAGTRGKIQPVLEDMKQRILGEYVEAPTTSATKPRPAKPTAPRRSSDAKKIEKVEARAAKPSTSEKVPAAVEARAAKPSTSGKVPAAVGARGPSTAEVSRLPGARQPARP